MLECPRARLSETIDTSNLPLTIELKPGVKKIEGLSLEIATIGNHTLCYQAILRNEVGFLFNIILTH